MVMQTDKTIIRLIWCATILYVAIMSSCDRLVAKADPELSPISHKITDLERPDIPDSIPSQEKIYAGYRLSFNADTKNPNWVAWELTADETIGRISRSNRFWTDNEIKGCPSYEDYRHSGYDRGHMAPAADMKWDKEAMTHSFALSNICPQDKELNSGAWNTLENKCRQWAQRDSALIIIAGPIFDSPDKEYIGDSVRVPDAFFKVILAPYVRNPRAIGFLFPNYSAPGNLANYSYTVDEIERITGFDFYPTLPDSIENTIERTTSFTEWNYNPR